MRRAARAGVAELLRVGLRLEPDWVVRRFECRQVVVSQLSGNQSADKTINISAIYPTVTSGIARRHRRFQLQRTEFRGPLDDASCPDATG
jgi:hypothetical protein